MPVVAGAASLAVFILIISEWKRMGRWFFRRVLKWQGSLREVRVKSLMLGKDGSQVILRPVG